MMIESLLLTPAGVADSEVLRVQAVALSFLMPVVRLVGAIALGMGAVLCLIRVLFEEH
jgi:hypothetical protein